MNGSLPRTTDTRLHRYVKLPGYSLDPGEAFISGDISKDLLRFIKENKLGKVLPYSLSRAGTRPDIVNRFSPPMPSKRLIFVQSSSNFS